MRSPELSYYTAVSNKLPPAFDGLKIIQLSDLHNQTFGKNNRLITDLINAENPDLVIMTGDMFSHSTPHLSDFVGMIENITKKYPLYYVNGNHELSDTNTTVFNMIAHEAARLGAVCVDNKRVTVKRRNESIEIAGLCYGAEYYKGVRKIGRNYKKVTPGVITSFLGQKTDRFTILLAHNPLDFDAQAVWGADVSFGGHIHGGVVRIPVPRRFKSIIGRPGLLSPERRLFPKYQAGHYTKRTHDGVVHHLIVSRGLGRFRINNRSDLVCCVLSCA
ncbi:MAG: metallophosphoesterase [Ruminococcus sp.]|jgi:predicted MPP superfamily phosphohydrolase|nr:metallophosphoesterase [Ruminococcus sp.]